jgi:N6-L-threonylcarbamoyladenine synthase
MIAAAGSILYEQGKRSDYSLNANPGLDLEIM